MPVSLGQAISGKYAQNYDTVNPLIKGLQIGSQRRQNDEVAKARKEAALQKQNDNFLKQVSSSILVKGIDDVDKVPYQEAVSGVFSEAQKIAESGDADSYVARMKLLGQIPIINANFQARGKAWDDLRTARNKGELSAEDTETLSIIERSGDPRKLKGITNKLFGNQNGNVAVNNEGMMVASPFTRVKVNDYMDKYVGDMGKQNIGIFQSAYPTMYQNIKGIPSDQAQLKQLAGSDYAKLKGVKTMEDLAAAAWDSNQNLQHQYLDDNRTDLLAKFDTKSTPINQNPKAMEYARAKFIDEQKNRAKAEMKLEGIKQVSNGGKDKNYNSYTNLGGGGILSNGIRIQPSSKEQNVYVLDKPNEKGQETEVLKATLHEGATPKPFDKIDDYIRVGNDKYILRGVYEKNPQKVFGLTKQQISLATGIAEDALATAKIAFDADKEEAKRQEYVKLRKSLGDTRDYSELFNGDEEGNPTFANKWKNYESKEFPKNNSTLKKGPPKVKSMAEQMREAAAKNPK